MAVFFETHRGEFFSIPASLFQKFGTAVMHWTLIWSLWKIALEMTENVPIEIRRGKVRRILERFDVSAQNRKKYTRLPEKNFRAVEEPLFFDLTKLPPVTQHPIFPNGTTHREIFSQIRTYVLTPSATSFHTDVIAESEIFWSILKNEDNEIAGLFDLFGFAGRTGENSTRGWIRRAMFGLLPFGKHADFAQIFPFESTEELVKTRKTLLGLAVYIFETASVPISPGRKISNRISELDLGKLDRRGGKKSLKRFGLDDAELTSESNA